MPRKPFGRSMVTTLLGLIIAVPAAVLTAASPASATGPCCRVSIDDLPGQFPTGSSPTPFTLRVVNQTQETLRYVDVSFLLQAQALVGDLVHLQRQRPGGDPRNVGTFTLQGVHSGAVTATDQLDFGTLTLPPGGGVSIRYQLVFNRKMPSTGLTVSVQVRPRRSDGGASSAGPYRSTIVAPGQLPRPRPNPTPTATVDETPTATDPADAGTVPTGQPSLSAGGPSSDGGGPLMWLAYAVGAMLLLGGTAVIATMLWRRRGTGHYAAPTAQFPVQQRPFAGPDQSWVDPAGRQ